jgi:hypothetical protein
VDATDLFEIRHDRGGRWSAAGPLPEERQLPREGGLEDHSVLDPFEAR